MCQGSAGAFYNINMKISCLASTLFLLVQLSDLESFSNCYLISVFSCLLSLKGGVVIGNGAGDVKVLLFPCSTNELASSAFSAKAEMSSVLLYVVIKYILYYI